MPPDQTTEPHVRIPLAKLADLVKAHMGLQRAVTSMRAASWVAEHVPKGEIPPEAPAAAAPARMGHAATPGPWRWDDRGNLRAADGSWIFEVTIDETVHFANPVDRAMVGSAWALVDALHDLLTRPTDPGARMRAREVLDAAQSPEAAR